jgi:Flp pilus assembly protein TadD
LKIAPKAPAVLRTYAYSLALRKEDLDRALRLARRAVKQSPYHPRAHHALGWVQYQKGRLEAAQRHLQTAIEKRAPTPRLLEHAGDVARARGNEAAAQRYWKRAAELVPPRPSLRKKLDRGSSP